MGGPIAKQMLEIENRPILRHTVELFRDLSFDVNIIIVINDDLKEVWKRYCRENDFEFRHILTSGGITRFHSVKNALKYVEPDGIVAIHDAVRPLATKEFITKLYQEIEKKGDALIPVVPVTDSLRMVTEQGSRHINREGIVSVQTPQLFRSDILLDSYRQPYSPDFTDDASVVEKAGYKVDVIDGERNNIKITTTEDLIIAKSLFFSRRSQD